jgi:hypothetical protein
MALQILLWLGVALVVLVGLLVCLPVYVAVTWQSDPVRRSMVLLRPFGGVSPQIKVFDSTHRRKPWQKRSGRKKPGRRKEGGATHGNVVAEAATLLRRVLGAIHFDALRLDVEFGLGDPAETGQLFGQLCPVIYGAGADVRLRPNFDVACLRGYAMAQFRVIPVAVAWPFASFGWRVFGPSR